MTETINANAKASYGLLAEFDSPETLIAATKHLRNQGLQRLDAFSPFPVEGLGEAIGFKSRGVQRATLLGGLAGGLLGYGLQYVTNTFIYPLNVGGRPLNSIPSFIPITFELTVLLAALSAVFTMLALNGLPRPYHPVFNVPAFARASKDAFFLCIEKSDPQFEHDGIRKLLAEVGAKEVYDVEE